MKKVTDKQAKKMIKMYDKYVIPLESKYTKIVSKFLQDQGKRLAKQLLKYVNEKKDNDKIDEDKAIKEADKVTNEFTDWTGEQIAIYTALKPLWEIAKDLSVELSNQIFGMVGDARILPDVINEDYLKYLGEVGANKAVYITRTTREMIRETIREGLIKGEPYTSIAENIVSQTTNMSMGRATTIVETEAHTSFGVSRNLVANEVGFDKKTWITAGDNSVRQTHRSLDRVTIKIDEKFRNGLMFPGDPKGAAKEVVRCRCQISYS